MKNLGKLVIYIFACSIALIGIAGFTLTNNKTSTPVLKDGDIIFQTSRSEQSQVILIASKSLYTHTGIIKHNPKGTMVIEAIGPVKETPLKDWVARGKNGLYAVYRYKNLNRLQSEKLFKELKAFYGKSYDVYFSFNNDKIYCSELVRDGYKAIGINLGKEEKIGDLLINVPKVEKLILKRAASDPECKNLTKKQCMNIIYARRLITPKSIADDTQLKRVYSNYPF